MSNVDLSVLSTLPPDQLEAVKALGANQGSRDPKSIAGRPQVWKVDNRWYLAYFIPGTQTPLVWEATPQELAEQFGGVNAQPPSPDKTLTGAQFQAMAPWQAGRINEIRNQADDPWTQFYADFNQSADLRPWLRDPDMLATIATAYLEGRQPTPDELSKTAWWQNRTEEERAWMEFAATGGAAEIEQRRVDMRTQVTNDMLKLGLTRFGQDVINHVANKVLTGQWSESYYAQQIAKLADPYAPGTLSDELRQLVGTNMTQTKREEDTVREMVTTWLGPTMGNMNEAEVQRWAGWLRNDPDAATHLTEYLRKQRMALFPGYENPNLTYEDIVSPFRNLASNIWGQPVDDETLLVDLANTGDYTEAAKRLRKTGLDKGVQKVVQDALGELGSTSLGDRVVRSTI